LPKKNPKWFKTNPEVTNIVKDCMQFKLSEKETLEKLAEKNYIMNARTLRRIKKDLPKPERLDKIATKGAEDHIIKSLKDYDFGIKEIKKIIKNANNPYLKLQGLGMLSKYRKDKAEFYDASPIIAALSKKLEQKDDLEKG